jgi:hypothetical protein
MTATAVPHDIASRSWNGLLRIVTVAALFVVLLAGSFAVGRSTADDSTTIEPAAATIVPADVPPVPDPASCGHTQGQNPPC